MASNGGGGGNADSKKRKNRYRPNNKPVKKGSYPLRPGVQGFFITCDGGRERQAAHEAVSVIDSFYEELVEGKEPDINSMEPPKKPLNKKIKFTYSDSDEDNSDDDEDELSNDKSESDRHPDATQTPPSQVGESVCPENQIKAGEDAKKNDEYNEKQEVESESQPAKRQCVEADASKPEKVISIKKEEKSVDQLIEAELEELKDKSKRRFSHLDSGCNGVTFVQMRKRDGDPSPKDIVQRMITTAASTRKHMSRFILRILPVEVTCYASEEEISRAIKPLVEEYFPAETDKPSEFAVLYEARANTGVDRMKIINAVAKSIPEPHKVDLKNPDKNIVVQIAKTVCCIGVVEKYKELAKYNLRQLTSSN